MQPALSMVQEQPGGEYFKERGEQYGAVWGNVAPFPFGSLIAKQLRGPIWSNMVQYGK